VVNRPQASAVRRRGHGTLGQILLVKEGLIETEFLELRLFPAWAALRQLTVSKSAGGSFKIPDRPRPEGPGSRTLLTEMVTWSRMRSVFTSLSFRLLRSR
jgi:hypothetical protein